jgi:hypothetical protein
MSRASLQLALSDARLFLNSLDERLTRRDPLARTTATTIMSGVEVIEHLTQRRICRMIARFDESIASQRIHVVAMTSRVRARLDRHPVGEDEAHEIA